SPEAERMGGVDPAAVLAEEFVHIDEGDPRAVKSLGLDDPGQRRVLADGPDGDDRGDRPVIAETIPDELGHLPGHRFRKRLDVAAGADADARPLAELVSRDRHELREVDHAAPSDPRPSLA